MGTEGFVPNKPYFQGELYGSATLNSIESLYAQIFSWSRLLSVNRAGTLLQERTSRSCGLARRTPNKLRIEL